MVKKTGKRQGKPEVGIPGAAEPRLSSTSSTCAEVYLQQGNESECVESREEAPEKGRMERCGMHEDEAGGDGE